MDSIDVRNLYNAYRQVCESQQSLNESVDLDEARRSKEERDARAKELGDKQTIDKIVNQYNSGRSATRQESPEKYHTEDLDTYDLVLEYLLDEGYCDDQQAAEVIMANMSEEWLAGILDEANHDADERNRRFIRRTQGEEGVANYDKNPPETRVNWTSAARRRAHKAARNQKKA
jgi:hypothetical protein